VVFDLDGTLTRETNSWAAIQRRLGPDRHARARERWRRFSDGGLTRTQFLEEQVADLAGTDSTLLDEVVAEVEYQEGVAPACAELVAAGIRLAIVSAGLSALADRVAADLGIHSTRANLIEVVDGRFTGAGTISVPPGGKEPAFLETCEHLGVAPADCVAVGDSGGDVDMFRLAALGVAFHPVVAEARLAADAVIEVADMRHLLPLVLA
jgi:phosphoserine phosphatase